MSDLIHHLTRELVIRAPRETVFEFFTESERWAAWWGAGSSIEATPGGQMYIRHANGVEVFGEVITVTAPERIIFTYGVPKAGSPTPTSTRVTITLQPHADGTLLQLLHEFDDVESRDHHIQGWRFQLSLFTNLVANSMSTRLLDVVDRWCAAWSNPDADSRNREIDAITASDIRFFDRYSTIVGREELRAHLAAVHRFMPGNRLHRRGEMRHCQWHVLADWDVTTTDGSRRSAGTNAYLFDADGRIREVTGFWSA